MSASTLKSDSWKVLGASETVNISKNWKGRFEINIKVAKDSVRLLALPDPFDVVSS